MANENFIVNLLSVGRRFQVFREKNVSRHKYRHFISEALTLSQFI